MNLIVNDLHIGGIDTKHGDKTAVLLHGWGTDSSTFSQISQVFDGYRIISPDLPGFGKSQPPNEPWGVKQYARFVVALLNKLELNSVDVFLGHSFGGRILLELVGTKMFEPKKLILLSSHGLPEPKSIKGRVGLIAAKIGSIATSFLPISTQEKLKVKLYSTLGSQDYISSGSIQTTFKKVIAQDATKIARLIDCPTLLVYGQQDITTPPEFGRQFNRLIPNSVLELVEDAGHYVHQDQPEAVKHLIRNYL
jgi:pimeloyl-ACP methyl ester carboxylesterase